MVRFEILILTTSFVAALSVPLLPYLVNGAPFIGDSWTHFKITREIVASGHINFHEYNERWPLVNFMLSFIVLLTGLNEVFAGALIPILVGSASIPLYCLCKRLGQPTYAAPTAMLFLTFNPLYSFVTFSGAVMKETATYFLVISILLLTTMALKDWAGGKHSIAILLTFFGAVMGHHFASLVLLFYLWALFGYSLFDRLRGARTYPMGVLTLALGFTLMAGAWNLLNYLVIEAFFPVFSLNDLVLLMTLFMVASAFQALIGSTNLTRLPWLVGLAFMISIFGLRGGIYLLLQPVPPISIWEARNYVVAGSASLLGLMMRPKSMVTRALAASTVSLVLFSYLWGFTEPGFVLLIKSLHYFSILLAVGAGFASLFLLRRGHAGRLAVLALSIFVVHSSWHGTELALNGLGAYRRGEFLAASNLPNISPDMRMIGDSKVSFLTPYAANIEISGIPDKWARVNDLLFLLNPDLRQGFLFNYDWAPTSYIIDGSELDTSNRVLDGEYLRLHLR